MNLICSHEIEHALNIPRAPNVPATFGLSYTLPNTSWEPCARQHFERDIKIYRVSSHVGLQKNYSISLVLVPCCLVNTQCQPDGRTLLLLPGWYWSNAVKQPLLVTCWFSAKDFHQVGPYFLFSLSASSKLRPSAYKVIPISVTEIGIKCCLGP